MAMLKPDLTPDQMSVGQITQVPPKPAPSVDAGAAASGQPAGMLNATADNAPPAQSTTAVSSPMVLPPAPGVQSPTAVPTPAALPQFTGTAVSPFSADQNLRTSQITPDASGATRYDVAGQQFDQFAQQTDPQYQAAIRQATQAASANGRLHSGMLTTDYGNLADTRTKALDLARQGFLTNALDNSFSDAAGNRNELRTERDYQNTQEQDAYNRAIQQLLVGDQLAGNEFTRNLQSGTAAGSLGYGSDPTSTLLQGSNQYAGQADSSAAAIAAYLKLLGYGGTNGA